MTKLDWLLSWVGTWSLLAAWVFVVIFAGPYLISQPSWVAVGLGFALLIGLVFATFKWWKVHYE